MAVLPVQDEELHAYVDGHLPAARRIEIEAWLARNEEAAQRVDAYRAQAELLHELFDPMLAEAPSEAVRALAEQLNQRLAARRRGWRGWLNQPVWRMAAGVALLVAGAVGGFVGNEAVSPRQPVPVTRPSFIQTFAEEAAQAHTFYTSENRFAVEMGADNREALDSWLSEKLGRTVFGPDLSGFGYHLIGGRSLPAPGGGAGAQYMYENDDHRRLTLFVGSPQGGQEQAFSYAQRGDVSMVYWVEGSLAYALIGQMNHDELMSITRTVHQEVKAGQHHASPSTATPGTDPMPPAIQPAMDVQPKDS
ncbi:MAG TPA: anti-sigma factor [Azospirillaceae bacterium]|nr:anti-sigma factor [Azospirillaceae bacterium]